MKKRMNANESQEHHNSFYKHLASIPFIVLRQRSHHNIKHNLAHPFGLAIRLYPCLPNIAQFLTRHDEIDDKTNFGIMLRGLSIPEYVLGQDVLLVMFFQSLHCIFDKYHLFWSMLPILVACGTGFCRGMIFEEYLQLFGLA
jgi:hypothetical protein